MASANLFTHPAFKDGAFTSTDRAVPASRPRPPQRGPKSVLEVASGCMGTYSALAAKSRHFVFWGGREGGESADRLVDRAG